MSESVRFVNANQSRGGDGDPTTESGTAEEMHEFITFNRQLSRPTDHFRPTRLVDNPYAPPPKPTHVSPHTYLKTFLRDPIASSLNTFSRVTSLVTSPTAPVWYDEDYHPNQLSTVPLSRPPGTAERVNNKHNGFEYSDHSSDATIFSNEFNPIPVHLPPPSLPAIACTQSQQRLPPLTPEELEEKFPEMSVQQILERIFRGGLSDNEFRQRLWPLVLGLSDDISEFDWSELGDLFNIYYNQWQSILPEQELRFTAYRERKSLIERDVIRCDRSHQFYKGTTSNLESLKSLLLTYTMYDFDTGYVQGMSDLASPLLYVMDGNVMKAFWCFVKVMKLIGTNFEMSQLSIKFQLEMLWKLIELTDPCFAQYLATKDSTNCYFAFRWIVCQFKREFMKTESDDYNDCLILWESIWTSHIIRQIGDKPADDESVQKEQQLLELKLESDDSSTKLKGSHEKINKSLSTGSLHMTSETNTIDIPDIQFRNSSQKRSNSFRTKSEQRRDSPKADTTKTLQQKPFFDPKLAEKRLSDAELYTLSICLSIIRRERDLIMAQRLDATEILKHFNTLQLNSDLEGILLHASHIWYWLTHDNGESLLYKHEELPVNETTEDYDLLNDSLLTDEDYYIINASNI